MIPGAFPILAGGAQKSIVFQEARHSSTKANSFTFTNVNLGYPDPTRLIVVGVSYYKFDTSVSLSSVVVGGNTATSRVTQSNDVQSGSFIYANISSVPISSGSTASVTVSFSGNIDLGCSIGIWSLYNLQSTTPVATDRDSAETGASSLSFTTQPDDIICSVLTGATVAGSTTWTNVTENYDTVVSNISRSGANTQVLSTGSYIITGTNTGVSPSFSGQNALVGAQWR